VEGAGEVDAEGEVPVGIGCVEQAGEAGDAGIDDDDVGVVGGVEGGFDGFRCCDVERDAFDAEFAGGGCGVFGRQVADGDRGSAVAQQQGGGAPDSIGAASDEGGLAEQLDVQGDDSTLSYEKLRVLHFIA